MKLAEHSGKAGKIFKSRKRGDLENRVVGIDKKILRVAHTGADNVSLWGHTGHLGEQAAKMRDADGAGGGEILLGEDVVVVKIFADEVENRHDADKIGVDRRGSKGLPFAFAGQLDAHLVDKKADLLFDIKILLGNLAVNGADDLCEGRKFIGMENT